MMKIDIDDLKAHIKQYQSNYKFKDIDGVLTLTKKNNVDKITEPSRELLQSFDGELDLSAIIEYAKPQMKRDDLHANQKNFIKNFFDLVASLAINPYITRLQVIDVAEIILDEESILPDTKEHEEWVDLVANSLIYPKSTSNTLAILSKNSVDITTTLEPLHEKLLFLRDAVNLVIGESKSGKTFTTCKSLVDHGFQDKIIHIDFDRNSDDKLRRLGVKTYHISDAEQLINDLRSTEIKNELIGSILVIDSLQDLSFPDGIDNNKSALDTMNNVLRFRDTGATVIVIHHTTTDKDGNFKVKGNATTITSKCDTTISFQRKDDLRTFKVVNTRAEDKIASGSTLTYNKDQRSKVPMTTGKTDEPPK